MSGLIILGKPQRSMSSSQYTLANTDNCLAFDLHHLASNPDSYW